MCKSPIHHLINDALESTKLRTILLLRYAPQTVRMNFYLIGKPQPIIWVKSSYRTSSKIHLTRLREPIMYGIERRPEMALAKNLVATLSPSFLRQQVIVSH